MRNSATGLVDFIADPWRKPLGAAYLIGFISHLDWSWFVLWLLGWLLLAGLYGLGHRLISVRRLRGIAKTLSDQSTSFTRVSPDALPPAAASALLALNAARDSRGTVVVVANSADRYSRLTFQARCFVGDSSLPALVVLPPQRFPIASAAEYELLHELGHAWPSALEAEFLAMLDPLFVLAVATAAFVTFGGSAVVAIWIVFWTASRLWYWNVQRRTGLEAEIIADSYAYRQLLAHGLSLDIVDPFVRSWSSTKLDRGQRFVGLMRQRYLSLAKRVVPLPAAPKQYSFFGAIATLALIFGPIFGPDSVWNTVFFILGLAIASLIVTAFAVEQILREEEFLQKRLNTLGTT